jgi:hypothetical protein
MAVPYPTPETEIQRYARDDTSRESIASHVLSGLKPIRSTGDDPLWDAGWGVDSHEGTDVIARRHRGMMYHVRGVPA